METLEEHASKLERLERTGGGRNGPEVDRLPVLASPVDAPFHHRVVDRPQRYGHDGDANRGPRSKNGPENVLILQRNTTVDEVLPVIKVALDHA